MTKGDEIALVADHIAKSLWLIDQMPIPLTPATNCLRAAIVRVQFELGQVAKERAREASHGL